MMCENLNNDSKMDKGFAVQIVSPQGAKRGSHYITVPKMEGDTLQSITERAMGAVRDMEATIVSMEVLGLSLNQDISLLEEATGTITWPITWIADNQVHNTGGIQIWAESDATVTPIVLGNYTAGSLIDTPNATIARLGGLNGRIPTRTHVEQTDATLNQMIDALQAVDMDFSHVVRTWFYNCDILTWYDDFNKTRDDFFSEHDICEGLIPASTGIGACNVSGTSLVTGVLAMKSKLNRATMIEVPSPLQCPATDYGSSFSRAAEIDFGSYRQLLVSGTASIEYEGDTVHQNNIDGQILCTLEVVEAILESRRMNWSNVTRAIAYVKHAQDIPRFEYHRKQLGLEALPFITMTAEICRSDLLFEIELDAIHVVK